MDAAIRELREETSFTGVEVWGPVWFGEVDLVWRGVLTQLAENFFVAHVPSAEPSQGRMEKTERAVFLEAKWWGIGELEASGEVFIPRGLPQLVRRLLLEGVGKAPLRIDLSTPE